MDVENEECHFLKRRRFCGHSQATAAFLLAGIIERDVKRLWFSAFFKPCRRTADVLGPLLKQQVAGMSILMSGECWGLSTDLDGVAICQNIKRAVKFAVLSSSKGSTSPQTQQQRAGVCCFSDGVMNVPEEWFEEKAHR